MRLGFNRRGGNVADTVRRVRMTVGEMIQALSGAAKMVRRGADESGGGLAAATLDERQRQSETFSGPTGPGEVSA